MPTANPRPEAPDAGSALPTPERDIRELFDIAIAGDRLARRTGNSFMLSIEKVAAFCRCSRSEAVPILRKIRRAMDGAEAAIEAALADAAPAARAAAAGDGAIDALLDKLVSCATRNGFYRHPTDPIAEGYIDEGVADTRDTLRRAIAAHTDAAVSAALSASGPAPSAGTVTLEEMAERVEQAVEGECDGLAITSAQATEIIAWALTDMEPGPDRDAKLLAILARLGPMTDTSILEQGLAAELLKRLREPNGFMAPDFDYVERTVLVTALEGMAAGRLAGASPQAQPVRIGYTNWRGEATTPTILPTRLFWGSNGWHPEPCWLLEAMDVEKQALRTFDIRKLRTLNYAPSASAGAAAGQGLREALEPIRAYVQRCHASPWLGGRADEERLLVAWGNDDPFDNAVITMGHLRRLAALASAEADGWWPLPDPPAPASAVGEAGRGN